jgi:hypothetical protein
MLPARISSLRSEKADAQKDSLKKFASVNFLFFMIFIIQLYSWISMRERIKT